LQSRTITGSLLPLNSGRTINGPPCTFKDIGNMHNFTPEDLLLYLYQETSPEATATIEQALKEDWTLREKLTVLKTSMERLESIVVSPRTEVILNVLRHAKQNEKISSLN